MFIGHLDTAFCEVFVECLAHFLIELSVFRGCESDLFTYIGYEPFVSFNTPWLAFSLSQCCLEK